MNRQELNKAVAAKTGKTQKEADAFLGAFIDAVGEALKEGEPVQLVGFGSFKAVKRSGRAGRNLWTGEAIDIPEKTVPKFVPGKALRELVGGR